MSDSAQSFPSLSPEQLTFAETAQWKTILRQALVDLRVCIPAIVQSFDPQTQVVSVQVAINELIRFPTGAQWRSIPPINNVPVCLPRAGGFSLTLPLEQGDEGFLVFCDTCIDLWWQNGGQQPGGQQPPVEGGSTAPIFQPNHEWRRRHDISDCGFFPMGWSQPRVLSNYSSDSAQLRSDDGNVIVDVAEAGVTVTAPKFTVNCTGEVQINGSQVVISSSGNNSEVDGVDFLDHTHSGVQSGGSDTGPVVP